MNRRGFIRAGISAGAAGFMSPLLMSRGWEDAWASSLPFPPDDNGTMIRLSSNENALGVAPSARKAILDGIQQANRYPFSFADELRKQLAQHHKVPQGCITLGCGSAEILQIVTQTYATRGALILMADPTFESLARYSIPFPAKLVKLPLRPDYSHDIDKMRELANRHPGPVLVYLCSPNNPTGTITDCKEIEEWVRAAPPRVNFFIDEAYYQLVRDPRYYSFSDHAAKQHNIIVAHTFSKVYAMAGMRQGYSISTPETRERLMAYSTGNGVNHLALVAASASLRDKDFLKESLAANDRARKILLRTLDDLGVKHLPSETNFVMFKLKGKIQEFNRRMAENNIRVGRPFPPMEDYCRLSLGLESEMETFCSTLRKFRDKGWI
jgi:histidinol-phosphate aminotransferase